MYLDDKEMRLDVGAVAKGYAAEMAAKEIMAMGLKSGMLRLRRQHTGNRGNLWTECAHAGA